MTNPKHDEVIVKIVFPEKSEIKLQETTVLEILHHLIQNDERHERRHLYEHSN